MNATVVVLLVCSLVALAAACCTPSQWEGKWTAIGGRAAGLHHELIQGYKEVSYDAINNRTASIEITIVGSTQRTQKIITRYDTSSSGKVYVLDYTTGKCSVFNVTTPFQRLCVPVEAKPVEKFFLGLSGALNATWYELSNKNVKNFIAVEELSNDVCVPVTEAVYGEQGQVGFVYTAIYTNITPGIKNTSVFDIPEQCKKGKKVALFQSTLASLDYSRAWSKISIQWMNQAWLSRQNVTISSWPFNEFVFPDNNL